MFEIIPNGLVLVLEQDPPKNVISSNAMNPLALLEPHMPKKKYFYTSYKISSAKLVQHILLHVFLIYTRHLIWSCKCISYLQSKSERNSNTYYNASVFFF